MSLVMWTPNLTTLLLYFYANFEVGKEVKNMNTEEFKSIIKELHSNIEILGEYVDPKTKIKCRCNIDNYEWKVMPRSIRKTGCPKCKGVNIKLTDSEYKEKLQEMYGNDVVSLEPYINAVTKILHRCNIHNNEFYTKPCEILNKNCGCKDCTKEKISRALRDSIENVKKKLYEVHGNEFELLDTEYKNNSTKMLFRHNMPDGSSHTFYSTINSLLSGSGCGVCHGSQICIGYNDIATTNPYVASLFENEEETHLYTEWSNRKVNFKCPNCGHVRNKKISQVSRYNELSCPICGDGYSYPNKFIYNCLFQIKDKLDFLYREYMPEWCKFDFHGQQKTGKYDIYFSVNGHPYFCEMDGSLGHGKRAIEISQEDALFIDQEKDRLAAENGIEVIRIDCDYSRNDKYLFIKENIFKSKLSSLIDLSCINFDEANIEAQSSLLVKACNLWNDGYNCQQICDSLDIVNTTVTNYLKIGSKYGICTGYSKEESRYRSHGREIICLNTRKKFRSIVDAGNYYGIGSSDVSKCCRRMGSYGGTYNGEKMIWMYLDEYEKLSEEEIFSYVPKENQACTKVICLNTSKVFDKMSDAIIWCNSKTTTGIVNCCTGKYHTSGKHPETGEPLKWMYYKDYIKKAW